MRLRTIQLCTIAFSIGLLITVTPGQETEPADVAYAAWKEKATAVSGLAGDHLGLAFAVWRLKSGGVKVQVSIAVGNSVSELSPHEVIVQPVGLRNGKELFDLGNPSRLRSEERSPLVRSASGIVARREITSPISEGTTAVKITVRGLGVADHEMSVIVKLEENTSTAVLGGTYPL